MHLWITMGGLPLLRCTLHIGCSHWGGRQKSMRWSWDTPPHISGLDRFLGKGVFCPTWPGGGQGCWTRRSRPQYRRNLHSIFQSTCLRDLREISAAKIEGSRKHALLSRVYSKLLPYSLLVFGESRLEVVEEEDVDTIHIGSQVVVKHAFGQALLEEVCHDVVNFNVIHIPVRHQYLRYKQHIIAGHVYGKFQFYDYTLNEIWIQ